MFTTTLLIALQIKYVKNLSVIAAVVFLLFFGFLDGNVYPNQANIDADPSSGLFWGASLRKVPDGAWVPLMMGLILYDTWLNHCFFCTLTYLFQSGLHAFLDMGSCMYMCRLSTTHLILRTYRGWRTATTAPIG